MRFKIEIDMDVSDQAIDRLSNEFLAAPADVFPQGITQAERDALHDPYVSHRLTALACYMAGTVLHDAMEQAIPAVGTGFTLRRTHPHNPADTEFVQVRTVPFDSGTTNNRTKARQ